MLRYQPVELQSLGFPLMGSCQHKLTDEGKTHWNPSFGTVCHLPQRGRHKSNSLLADFPLPQQVKKSCNKKAECKHSA